MAIPASAITAVSRSSESPPPRTMSYPSRSISVSHDAPAGNAIRDEQTARNRNVTSVVTTAAMSASENTNDTSEPRMLIQIFDWLSHRRVISPVNRPSTGTAA